MMDILMIAQDAEVPKAGVDFFNILVFKGGNIGYLLWAMSFVVISLSIWFFMQIRRVNIIPEMVRAQIAELFEAKQYREAIDLTEGQPDFLSYIVHAALTDASHGYPAMERAMEEAADEQTARLVRSIEILSLFASIGPMLGLLGTVWGMIGAFFTLASAQGSPDPKALAPQIGVALVTTLLGLVVAIPAMSSYSMLKKNIDAFTSEGVMSAQELIQNFRPAKR